MHAQKRYYWVIEIERKFEVVFRKRLPGYLTVDEIANILQRLACQKLSVEEIISASGPKSFKKSELLDVRVDAPPIGETTVIWIPAATGYKAIYVSEEKLGEFPDILNIRSDP